MEAVRLSTVASRHFSTTSHSVSTSRGFSDSKYAGARSSTAKLGSSWTASRSPAWLASRNLFTRETWGWVNSKQVVVTRKELRGIVRAEMFGQLTSGLESAWSKLKGEGEEFYACRW